METGKRDALFCMILLFSLLTISGIAIFLWGPAGWPRP